MKCSDKMQSAIGNNSTPKPKKRKQKGTEPQFKPETNQPNIKSLIVPVENNNKNIHSVPKGHNPKALNTNKKRSPPTLPERSAPPKHINMGLDTEKDKEPKEVDTTQPEEKAEDVEEIPKKSQEPLKEPELSPELAMLRELLQEDMECAVP